MPRSTVTEYSILPLIDEAPERSGARCGPRFQAPSRPAPEQLLEILHRHRAQSHTFVLVILVRPESSTEPRAGRLSPGTICAGSNGHRSLQRLLEQGRALNAPGRQTPAVTGSGSGSVSTGGAGLLFLGFFCGPRIAAPAVTKPTDRRTAPDVEKRGVP